MKVKADEFDGKVVYGEKKKEGGAGYAGHRSELAPTLATLTSLETQVCLQLLFYYFILLDFNLEPIIDILNVLGSAPLLNHFLQMRGSCLNKCNFS